MKRNPMNRLRRAFGDLRGRAADTATRLGRHTDEVLTEEPIDFSAPSIPYYENLAARLSLVRVVLYMVLFVFVVVTVVSNRSLITYENLYYLAKDIGAATQTAHAEADHLSYPISSSNADFTPFRGGLVVAGSEVVTALSASGRQTLLVNVDYTEPVVRASEKYFLTFSRGGKSFSVYNAFVQVHRELTEFPVYEASVADDGTFAILTRSQDYTSKVIVYDRDMEPLAAYHLGGYVTGLSMCADGSAVGITSVESVAGRWETKVTVIPLDKRITEQVVTLSDTFASGCSFISDRRLAVLCADRLMIFKTDATVTREIEFKDSEPRLSAMAPGRIAILTRSQTDLSDELLTVYDRDGDVVYSIDLPADHPIRLAGGAEHMAFDGQTLYLRAGDSLYRLSSNGKTLSVSAISRDTLSMLPGDGGLLICTPAYATRLDEDAFTPVE